MRYIVGWSTDYGEHWDTTGYVTVEANSEKEAESKAVLPRHSVIDYIEIEKEVKQ